YHHFQFGVCCQVGALCFQIGIPEILYWRTSQEFVSQAMQLPLPHWVSISSLHAAVTSQVPATLRQHAGLRYLPNVVEAAAWLEIRTPEKYASRGSQVYQFGSTKCLSGNIPQIGSDNTR